MKEKYDKKKAIEAILEYIYFMENNRDENGELAPKDPMKFDSRRKQLHLVFATSGKPVPTTNFQSGGVPVKTVVTDVESGLTKPNRKK